MTKAKGGANKKYGTGRRRETPLQKKTTHPTAALNSLRKKTGKDGEQVARYCLTSLVPGERERGKNLLSVSFFFLRSSCKLHNCAHVRVAAVHSVGGDNCVGSKQEQGL